MSTAKYWIIKDESKKEIQCLLCPHVCIIPESERGICLVRENKEGILILINYGRVTAAALDPIEKKPLKTFMPNTNILSLGTFGCNLACDYCQNWTISRNPTASSEYLSPEQAVEKALSLKSSGNIGIAYTYSEPLMWYEYVFDTAKLAREAGLKNILVTNGYINTKPLQELLPYIDAVNLDIKAYTDRFYNDLCKGSLAPVLKSAGLFAAHCHLEVTTLLIPGLNDSVEEITELAEWIANLDKNIPLHLTRYYPNYRLNLPPTSAETMIEAKDIARNYLNYVFLGNI